MKIIKNKIEKTTVGSHKTFENTSLTISKRACFCQEPINLTWLQENTLPLNINLMNGFGSNSEDWHTVQG